MLRNSVMFCLYFMIDTQSGFNEFWNSGLETCQTEVRPSETYFVDNNKERNKNSQYLQGLPLNVMS